MGTCFHYGQRLLKNQIPVFKRIKTIAIIGSGTMGVGIAIDILNKTDFALLLIDISDAALERAARDIRLHFAGLARAGRILEDDVGTYLGRVSFTKDYSGLKDAQVIWEVATERADIKAEIFKLIEKHSESENLAFVYSNTSSHTTAELAELFDDKMLREKFLTGHGYFPFHANRLFDVMKGKYASEQTYAVGVAFAEQILEKKVIALPNDHHGYIADPIFEGMGAIISWDIKTGRDLVELPLVFEMMTANPFGVLDRTGHMPYTESARHLGKALPEDDRLKSIYNQDGRHYPEWIEDLEKAGRIGVGSEAREGFFKWTGPAGRERPEKVYDPETKKYIDIPEPNWSDFWSVKEANALDEREGTIKSIEGLVKVAESNDRGGKTFRRYAIPIMLYGLDLIQDGFASPGDVNTCTRAGLRFKFGLCEIIDGFLNHFGIDGFVALVKKAALENSGRDGLFDIDGRVGPRQGKPSLLFEMKARGWTNLLGYGRVYGTPVSQRNCKTGGLEPYYNDIRFIFPNSRDRVGTVIFDNPLRGNVWNKYTLDQLDHAVGISIDLYEKGELGSLLFTASGKGMRMLGADARQFSRGWFDPARGYQFLGEEESSYFTRAGMAIFRFLQECPIWTIGAFGEKWGGGAEFTYFLNQRFDLRSDGVGFDTIARASVRREKANYNQPEIEYAILGGFGAVQELRRLGFGDSIIDEVFLQGLTATRALDLGLANGVSDDEYDLLERAYEVARLKQRYAAPYSVALYNLQKKNSFREGINDERLITETGETFNPDKNPYVSTGLLRLLNLGGRNPKMDLSVRGDLPGWKNTYNNLF